MVGVMRVGGLVVPLLCVVACSSSGGDGAVSSSLPVTTAPVTTAVVPVTTAPVTTAVAASSTLPEFGGDDHDPTLPADGGDASLLEVDAYLDGTRIVLDGASTDPYGVFAEQLGEFPLGSYATADVIPAFGADQTLWLDIPNAAVFEIEVAASRNEEGVSLSTDTSYLLFQGASADAEFMRDLLVVPFEDAGYESRSGSETSSSGGEVFYAEALNYDMVGAGLPYQVEVSVTDLGSVDPSAAGVLLLSFAALDQADVMAVPAVVEADVVAADGLLDGDAIGGYQARVQASEFSDGGFFGYRAVDLLVPSDDGSAVVEVAGEVAARFEGVYGVAAEITHESGDESFPYVEVASLDEAYRVSLSFDEFSGAVRVSIGSFVADMA